MYQFQFFKKIVILTYLKIEKKQSHFLVFKEKKTNLFNKNEFLS